MYRIMALAWLAAGLAVFALEYATGEVRFRIRGLGASVGWLLLVVALYNFARWFGSRTAPESKGGPRHRKGPSRRAAPRERPEPDPTFDFTDRPGPRPGETHPPQDRPPGNN